jgi:rhodanese-related sulfurtransferase
MTETIVKAISPEALLLRYQREPELLLLDVRSEEEWAERHIPGARLLPMFRLISRRGELDPLRETIVVCEHGVRSYSVALVLVARLGFVDVTILKGGISAWTGPVEQAIGSRQ